MAANRLTLAFFFMLIVGSLYAATFSNTTGWTNVAYTHDGDWATYGTVDTMFHSDAYLMINDSLPGGGSADTSTTWLVKYGTSGMGGTEIKNFSLTTCNYASGLKLLVGSHTHYNASSYCYQETANVSTICGGLDTGAYAFDPNYFYINYTKPATATNNSLWQVKHGSNGTANIPAPAYNITASCWNYDASKLILRISSTGMMSGDDEHSTQPQCFNGTWINIGVTKNSSQFWTCAPPDGYADLNTTARLYDGDWGTNASYTEYPAGTLGWLTCTAFLNTGYTNYDPMIWEEAMYWSIPVPDSYATNWFCCSLGSCASPTADSTTIPSGWINVGEYSSLSSEASKVYEQSVNWVTQAGTVVCGNPLNKPGAVYTMNASVSGVGSGCFTFGADNVTLDCQGNSIVGTNFTTANAIISVDNINSTIRNCNISNFTDGIQYDGVMNGSILSSNISIGNGKGIWIGGGSSFNTISNTASSSIGWGQYALYLSFANYNSIINFTGYADGAGMSSKTMQIDSSDFNNFTNSIFIDNGTSQNYVVLINGGNNNTFSNINATSYTNTFFQNTVFQLQGIADGNIFKDSYMTSNFDAGAPGTSFGMLLGTGSGGEQNQNVIRNITFASFKGTGISIAFSPSSSNNIICLNKFTNTSDYYVRDLNGTNSYNCTYDGKNQGNAYANVLNGSIEVVGSARSSVAGLYIGTTGAGVPYDITSSAGKFSCSFAGCADYAPLNTFVCGNLNETGTYTMTTDLSTAIPPTTFSCYQESANVSTSCGGLATGGYSNTSGWDVFSSPSYLFDGDWNSPAYVDTSFVHTDAYGMVNYTIPPGGSTASLWQIRYATYHHGPLITANLSTSSCNYNGTLRFAIGSHYNVSNYYNDWYCCSLNSCAPPTMDSQTLPAGWTLLSTYSSTDFEATEVAEEAMWWIPNTTAPGTCFTVTAQNVTLNCAGHSITGNNTVGTYGVYSNMLNTTVENCKILNFTNQIYYDGSNAGLILNNTLSGTGPALLNISGIGNSICLNNFTATSGLYASDLNSNSYNCTYDGKNQGNIWANVMNGSINVIGDIPSSIPGLLIGRFGTGIPYNNISSAGKLSCAGCADYAPLTNSSWTFTVTQTEPINNTVLIGTQLVFGYSLSTLYAPVQCLIYVNGLVVSNSTVNSTNVVTLYSYPSFGVGSWSVLCYHSTYNYSTPTRIFNVVAPSFTDYYNISLNPENVFNASQALFYDINGNLNVMYFSQAGGFPSIEIRTLNGSSVTKNYTLPMPNLMNLLAALRLSNQTLLLGFDQTTGSSANFITLNNSSISSTAISLPYSVVPNTFWDPYTLAYTKQFSTLNITPDSYYLFTLPVANGANLVKMNATLNGSGVSAFNTVETLGFPTAWQTIAKDNQLKSWYYAKLIPAGNATNLSTTGNMIYTPGVPKDTVSGGCSCTAYFGPPFSPTACSCSDTGTENVTFVENVTKQMTLSITGGYSPPPHCSSSGALSVTNGTDSITLSVSGTCSVSGTMAINFTKTGSTISLTNGTKTINFATPTITINWTGGVGGTLGTYSPAGGSIMGTASFDTTLANAAIAIYSYNGSNTSAVATPDANLYSGAQVSNSKVIFENYENKTYFMQFGQVLPSVYQIETGKKYTFNATAPNPSSFYFVDAETFIFFSVESGSTWAYSCYFGDTNATCNRISSTAYGAVVPYNRGSMTTSKRIPNILTGPQDVVTTGIVSNGANATVLNYRTYTYDLKIACYDEPTQARKPLNVRIFSSTASVVMDPNTYLYGYVMQNSLLGTGVMKVYSYCIDPLPVNGTLGNGTSRMYVYGTGYYKLDTFSLHDIAPNAYYTFYVQDCFAQPSRNALLTATRFMNDRQAYAIVEQSYTSLAGDAVLFLQPFIPYKMNILSADGVSQNFDFTPATTASTTIPVGCAGLSINTTPTGDQVFDDVTYLIKAVTMDGEIVTGGATNKSVTVSFNYSSPSNRVASANYLIYMTGASGERMMIYNETDFASSGYRSFFINATTGPATYDLMMGMNVLRLYVNNSNNTYNMSSSNQMVMLNVGTSVTITRYDASTIDIRKNLQNSFCGPGYDIKNPCGGGWAYIFLATIFTMLVVGYVSRFTLDGAGLIGSVFFLGLALLNPISILVAGVVLPMYAIGGISLVVTIILVIWRYV